jgi:hypothetical protein
MSDQHRTRGTWLRLLAECMFDRSTLERVISPALADLQHECVTSAGGAVPSMDLVSRVLGRVEDARGLPYGCYIARSVAARRGAKARREADATAGNLRASRVQGWRRGRDSNPWKPSGFNGFQDRRLKPLGHLSSWLLLHSVA